MTLAASWITYTTIPIYAAMKAIDPALFEAAVDLGASWWTRARRILIPLAAPGIFIAMILVYIPMFTDFVTANLVGGTNSYMLGNAVNDLILVARTTGVTGPRSTSSCWCCPWRCLADRVPTGED